MAFRFGGKIAAGASRALLGKSTTQIRGYCEQVSSTSEDSPLRTAIAFGAGGVTAFSFIYLVFGIKLKELQEEERERQLKWDTRWR